MITFGIGADLTLDMRSKGGWPWGSCAQEGITIKEGRG